LIYLLPATGLATGLTPGGNSTVYIYTQTVHRTTQQQQQQQQLLLLLLLLLLTTAIGLSPGGSGYFTCTQICDK